MAADEVTILLHCRNLPGSRFGEHTAVRLGVQRGKEVIDDVSGDADEVTFTVPLRVSDGDGRPNFLGPYAQGRPHDRFIYLSWGERHEGEWEMFRRAKITLSEIDPEIVENAMRDDTPIEATIDMTDTNGGPLCARVGAGNIQWNL